MAKRQRGPERLQAIISDSGVVNISATIEGLSIYVAVHCVQGAIPQLTANRIPVGNKIAVNHPGDDWGIFFGDMGKEVEIRLGFSFHSAYQAMVKPQQYAVSSFDAIRGQAATTWKEHLNRIQVTGAMNKRKLFLPAPCTTAYSSQLMPAASRPFQRRIRPGGVILQPCGINTKRFYLLFTCYPERSASFKTALAWPCRA